MTGRCGACEHWVAPVVKGVSRGGCKLDVPQGMVQGMTALWGCPRFAPSHDLRCLGMHVELAPVNDGVIVVCAGNYLTEIATWSRDRDAAVVFADPAECLELLHESFTRTE